MGFKSLKPEAKTQVNRFSLTVGTSGNTTYILDQTFPAGDYTIEFSSGDTTYDIYAIGTDGTNVGYTNGVTLTANAPINEIVVLGAADNEVITFENIVFTVAGGSETSVSPSSKGDVASAGAFITSVSVSSMPTLDDTTTITGGNFAADVQVFFTGQDNVQLEAKSLTRNSSTELIATRPDALDATDSPYTVKVVNPGVAEPTGSSAHLLPNSITAGANPSWVTAAAQEYNPSAAVSITLSATDADGTVSYSLQSGTLPGGLSLNGSTGEISGTPTTSDGDVNVFTIRATDEGGNFVDREFTFTAAIPTIDVEYLVIAGGGGGGRSGDRASGGGGAGGYRSSVSGESSGGGASAESILELDPGTNYTVTIGAGGGGAIAGNEKGNNGSNSVFTTITSTGGGGGGSETEGFGDGLNGGSGGGGGGNTSANGGTGTANQGFDGGDSPNNLEGGGGGGASTVGQNAASGVSGDAGDGISSSITGSATFRSGGGGGAGRVGAGAGGNGGGGDGGSFNSNTSGQNGTANTGGGGGASPNNTNGGAGGSGVVILRYATDYTITLAAGLTGSTTTVGSKKVTTITAGTGNVSFS